MKSFFRKLDIIFEITVPVLFLAFGITVLVFSGYDFVTNNAINILAILLMIQGAAKIADFIGEHRYNEPVNFGIIFGIISIAMGIVFLATNLNISHVCTIWGIYEIVEGAFEVQSIVIALKKREWVAIIELMVALICIVFGILLVIHGEEDIKLHLIAVGVVFILSAAGQVIKTISEHKKEKTE